MLESMAGLKVVLVRHSTAVDPYDADTDEQRWLTSAGRERMRRVAPLLVGKLRPTHIYTSPLVRAVQTSEILAGEAGLDTVTVHGALAVEYGTTAEALSVLDPHSPGDVVVLVTHEPKVRVLAGHLAGLSLVPGFHTGGAMAVEFPEASPVAELLWWLDSKTLELSASLPS